MVTLIVIQFLVIGGLLWYIKARDDRAFQLKESKIETSENFLRTVAMGLMFRFSFPVNRSENNDGRESPHTSSLFLEQTENDFIEFASSIIQRNDGGTVYLTNHARHNRTHFEIDRADGTYIGMAIVSDTDIQYETIALLHSHLIKEQAQGGYIITTSDFSTHAKSYARELEISLINGRQLAIYWIEQMEAKRYEEEHASKPKRSS